MLPTTAVPEVFLSKDKVAGLAHCVIKPFQCEWKDCAVILNSHETLLKHLQRHCHHVVPQDGIYHCLYLRCAGRMHSSTAALIAHAELSHLSRVPLPCPIHGCNEDFLRESQLEEHFVNIHSNLLDQHLPINSNLLAPTSRPFLCSVNKPSSLESPHTESFAIISSVSPAPHCPNSSSINGTAHVTRKWSRLDVQDEECDKHDIVFEDLPHCQTSSLPPSPTEIKIQKTPYREQALLSRPQPIIYPPIINDIVPKTMLYSTFLKKADDSEGRTV